MRAAQPIGALDAGLNVSLSAVVPCRRKNARTKCISILTKFRRLTDDLVNVLVCPSLRLSACECSSVCSSFRSPCVRRPSALSPLFYIFLLNDSGYTHTHTVRSPAPTDAALVPNDLTTCGAHFECDQPAVPALSRAACSVSLQPLS